MMTSRKLLATIARNLTSSSARKASGQPTLKPLIYKNCTTADYNQLMDAIIHGFGPREPHNAALGLTTDDLRPLLEFIIATTIHNPYTVKAIDPDLDKIVGFRVMSYGSRNNDPRFKNEGGKLDTEKLSPKLRRLVTMLTEAYTILLDKTDFENFIHCEAIFLEESHISLGYANHLIKANIDWVEVANSDVDASTGICSAPGSYHAAMNIGSKEIGRISEDHYKDLKFDNGWNKIVAVAKDIRPYRTKKK